jgi:hypothetical protein
MEKIDMSALGRLRNFWIPWVAMIVLGCFSDAVAQTRCKVIDLGVLNNKDNLSCAVDLNNFGWTLSMNGVLDPTPASKLQASVASTI